MWLATGWTVRSSNLLSVRDFPFCILAQTGPSAHSVPDTTGTGVFPGVKWRRPGADHPFTFAIDRTLPGTIIIISVTSVSEVFRPMGNKYAKLYAVFIINIPAILHSLKLGLMDDFRTGSRASISVSVSLHELHWRNTQTICDILPDGLTIHYRLPISLFSSTKI
jgi:hypothetical protein